MAKLPSVERRRDEPALRNVTYVIDFKDAVKQFKDLVPYRHPPINNCSLSARGSSS